MKSFNRIFLAFLFGALALVVIPARAQTGDLSEGLPDNSIMGESDFPSPVVTENEPLVTDEPWGQAIPEAAPEENVISLNMRGVDITEVLRVMFKWAGYNYSIDPSISGKVTIGLENVPFDAALRAVLEQVGATAVKEEGIYKIKPESATATGGFSSIGVPRTPQRLRVVEVRFAAAEEMARIFGGKAAGSNALYGGFESWTAGGGGGTSTSNSSTSNSSTGVTRQTLGSQ